MGKWTSLLPALFLLLFIPLFACSQGTSYDQLYKKDGSVLEVILVEIKEDEVLYRKKDDPEGPIYGIVKSELLSLKRSNGERIEFSVSVHSFYEDKPAWVSKRNEGEKYAALPPKNEFQEKILKLPSDRLNDNFQLFRVASKKGKALGFAGVAVQTGVTLIGTVILAANSETDAFGNIYYTNPSAARTGALMMVGGTISGGIMGVAGFVRAARNGNKAKYIRDEMRRRGVQVKMR